MKKVLVFVVFLAAVVLGYSFGPTLYQRMVPPTPAGEAQAPPQTQTIQPGLTPWGKITKVEAVEAFEEEGMGRPIRPESGHRLWVVRFDPSVLSPIPAPAVMPPPVSSRDLISEFEKCFLVDTTGDKHPFYWGSMASEPLTLTDQAGRQRTFDTYLELMAFSMPSDRQPRSLQLGDGSRVDLP